MSHNLRDETNDGDRFISQEEWVKRTTGFDSIIVCATCGCLLQEHKPDELIVRAQPCEKCLGVEYAHGYEDRFEDDRDEWEALQRKAKAGVKRFTAISLLFAYGLLVYALYLLDKLW